MYELFIEGEQVDINDKVSVMLTFAIDDIAKFSSRETSFSKQIVLPGTNRNNKLLGHIGDLANSNIYSQGEPNIGAVFNVAQTSRAELRYNGLLILKGVFRLTGIIRNGAMVEYEGALFGELSGLITAISNKKLEDLDFSEYDHEYNHTNIEGSWVENTTITGGLFSFGDNQLLLFGNYQQFSIGYEVVISGTGSNDGTYTISNISYNYADGGFLIIGTLLTFDQSVVNETGGGITVEIQGRGSGYFYPLIDYGNFRDANNKDYDLGTFRPALYVKEYLDKMFKAAGYGYRSEFLNSEFFRSLIVPGNTKQLTKLSTVQLTGVINDGSQEFNAYTLAQPWLSFDTITGGNFTITDANGRFEYTNANTIQVKIKFVLHATYTVSEPNGFFNARVAFRQNGIEIQSYTYNSETGDIAIELFVDGTLQQGDMLDFFVDMYSPNPDPFTGVTLSNIYASFDITTLAVQEVLIQSGDTVSVTDTIPKGIFQKDFLASILKMFNLYVYESKLDEKVLNIVPYKDFMTTEQIDWSDKIARDKTWNIKPMGFLNGRIFEYKYKEDSDFYNEGYKKKFNQTYGDRQFDTGFQFAKDKQTTEVIFAPSPLIQYEDDDKFLVAIYKKSNALSAEDRMDSNIRILFSKKLACDEWNIKDGVNDYAKTFYGYAGHLDDPTAPVNDLNFGAPLEVYCTLPGYPSANLFNTYWFGYISEIADKDSKLLSCYAYLTPLDIVRLDFAKMVFIDGVLFRVNKIEDFDFTNNELTKVELLKVINNG